MKIKAEIELEIDQDSFRIPNALFATENFITEDTLVKTIQEAESWGECKVLKAEILPE